MSKAKTGKNGNFKYWIVAVFISFYVRFCGFLTRYIHGGDQKAREIDKKQRVIYAFWHNQQTFLLYPYRKQGKICVLVSQSKDGEYIAKALPKFKMQAVRGSTTRGGSAALRNLIDMAQEGYNPAITPDGPRGPIYNAHSGIIYLAQKTHLPIIAAGVACSHKFAVNSWDKFQIPLPVGKCAVIYAPPLWVGENDDIEECRKKLTDYLNDATKKAREAVS